MSHLLTDAAKYGRSGRNRIEKADIPNSVHGGQIGVCRVEEGGGWLISRACMQEQLMMLKTEDCDARAPLEM